MPVIFLIFMVFVLSGIASLGCAIDEHGAHKAPMPFTIFFALLGMMVLALTLEYFGSYRNSDFGEVLAFYIGAPLGLVGGGLLGYWLGLRRRRRYPSVDNQRASQGAT